MNRRLKPEVDKLNLYSFSILFPLSKLDITGSLLDKVAVLNSGKLHASIDKWHPDGLRTGSGFVFSVTINCHEARLGIITFLKKSEKMAERTAELKLSK